MLKSKLPSLHTSWHLSWNITSTCCKGLSYPVIKEENVELMLKPAQVSLYLLHSAGATACIKYVGMKWAGVVSVTWPWSKTAAMALVQLLAVVRRSCWCQWLNFSFCATALSNSNWNGEEIQYQTPVCQIALLTIHLQNMLLASFKVNLKRGGIIRGESTAQWHSLVLPLTCVLGKVIH